MCFYRKKKNIPKHLSQAFYLFASEVDREAIQFSYFLGEIRIRTAQFLNQKNKIPE